MSAPAPASPGVTVERLARLGAFVSVLVLFGTVAAVAVERIGGDGTTGLAGSAQPVPDRAADATDPTAGDDWTGEGPLLAYTSGSLPDGFADDVAGIAGVSGVTVVASARVDLVGSWDAGGERVDAPDVDGGYRIPLDAFALDPEAHARVLPHAADTALADLAPGRVVLSESSAALRGLGEGATLQLTAGPRLRVAGVVDDELVGAAELVTGLEDGETLGITRERFVVAALDGEPELITEAIEDVAGDESLRLREADAVPHLRHGTSVLPQVEVKERFGEFSYRDVDDDAEDEFDRQIVPDPAWEREHLAGTRVPILGAVLCHEELLPAVEGAMTELAEAGLDHLVDVDGYAGCYGPRLMAPDAGLSRHSWGMAIDLNAEDNWFGAEPSQDPRLIETMERWGFTWGGSWLTPDGMHFEYVTEPEEAGT
jgi:hypothetical protein